MKLTTLCYLHTASDILLAMKKKGLGVGKLNGVGGKVEEGETVEQAIVRETMEEIGVSINEENLEKVAIITFTHEVKTEWNQECHIFMVSEWEGDPVESEEMSPEWYSKNNLPLERMWESDAYWLSDVLGGDRIMASFNFDKNMKMKNDFAIEPLIE